MDFWVLQDVVQNSSYSDSGAVTLRQNVGKETNDDCYVVNFLGILLLSPQEQSQVNISFDWLLSAGGNHPIEILNCFLYRSVRKSDASQLILVLQILYSPLPDIQ